MLKQIPSEETTIRKRPVDKIENEISQLKIRMNKLEDGFADGHISADILIVPAAGTNRKLKP